MKWVKQILSAALFLAILVMLLGTINVILMPKNLYQNSDWPTTNSYNQFYDMKKDTVDVLFLGSSIVVNDFYPQELYDRFGITSYNLGSEQQSIILSYFWLNEALRFQNPKVVVLDTRYLFTQSLTESLNMSEGMVRKCIDPMKWSKVKAEAVKEICELDDSQSELSYYLPNIRYHSRWTELERLDFDFDKQKEAGLKGFGPLTTYGDESFSAFCRFDTEATESVDEVMGEYLERIMDLCRENGIELILTSIPGSTMYDGINNCLEKYGSTEGVRYINFCESSIYDAVGAELPRENIVSHGNIWGAIKLTDYLGNILQNEYGLENHVADSWEETKEYAQHILNNCNLTHVGEISEYFSLIDNEDYVVFITTKDEGVPIANADFLYGLLKLGIQTDLQDTAGNAYYAVVDGDSVIEEFSEKTLNMSGSFSGEGFSGGRYRITSGGWKDNVTASVCINDVEYVDKGGGAYFVIFDKRLDMVIDSAYFNWYETEGCLIHGKASQ